MLRDALLRTLAWFATQEYAPTAFEVWKWMDPWTGDASTPAFLVVRRELGELCQHGDIITQDGLFALAGYESLFTLREERARDSVQKLRRLNRVVRFLRLLPTLRAIFACNTLAWSHTRPESDLDLLLVVRHGWLWTTRLLATLPLALLRLRPEETKQNPVCLSFFLSEKATHLGSLRLSGGDPYLWYWLHALIPLHDPLRIKEQLDLSLGEKESPASVSSIERICEKFEWVLMPSEIKRIANTDTRVILSRDMLKFHVGDRRLHFREAHRALCEALGLPPFDYENI
ncbi:hypothetical protein HYW18_00945 [Candidatus Uhrbacteria bacterium]|nr:hypothetical protein [Candidatus Uhrbacteria bacterium]